MKSNWISDTCLVSYSTTFRPDDDDNSSRRRLTETLGSFRKAYQSATSELSLTVHQDLIKGVGDVRHSNASFGGIPYRLDGIEIRWLRWLGKQIEVYGVFIQPLGYYAGAVARSPVESCRRTNELTVTLSCDGDVTRTTGSIPIHVNIPQMRIRPPPSWRVPCWKMGPWLHGVFTVLLHCHRHVPALNSTHQSGQHFPIFLESSAMFLHPF